MNLPEKTKFARGSFLYRMMKIAVPVAFQAMLQSSFSMIDEIMVGQLGTAQIAAVEIGSKPGFIFNFVSAAVATVTGIMVSQYMGKQDEESVRGSMAVNMYAVLIIALLTAVSCAAVPERIAGMFSGDASVLGEASGYIRIVAWAYPLSGIVSILAVELRCRDHSSYPLCISAISAVTNTVLNYILIFGHFGIEPLGVRGAAAASVISQLIGLAVMCAVYRGLCRFSIRPDLKGDALRQYLVMLLPIVINEFLWSVGQNVFTSIYGHIGTGELAAMSLTGPMQGLFIGAMSGISQAAGIMIGKRLGEGSYDAAYREAIKLCAYGLLGSIMLSALLLGIRGSYTGAYAVGQDVRDTGAALLAVFAVLAPVKVENMILGGGVIRSGGRTKYIMLIDMAGTWLVGVPLGFIAGIMLGLPIVWTYFILSQEELFRLVITIFMFRSRKWMNTIE